MLNPFTDDTELSPRTATIYRNHVIVLLPKGDKWEEQIINISPVCLAPVFDSQQEAFSYGKIRVDRETSILSLFFSY